MPDHRPMRWTSQPKKSAFSLVEMLAVMAIMVILLVMLAPAINSATSVSSRKGAVNILMNTFEQARVSALESGRTVYVIFWRRIFPDPDAIMVLRDPDPTSKSQDYEQLTKWIDLPKGVLLHEVGGNNILSVAIPPASSPSTSTAGVGFNTSKSPVPLKTQSGESLNILAFNAFGGISFPGTNTKLMLIVSEGIRGNGGTEAMISSQKEKAGGFEIITLRRYTGRASLDVSEL